MKVLVDGVVFTNTHQQGIQRIFRDLLARLAARDEVKLLLTGPPVVSLPAGVPLLGRRWGLHRWPHRLNLPVRAWRAIGRSSVRWWSRPFDLFHSTFYTRSPVPGIPEVVTVYDMIVERHRALLGDWADHQAAVKRPCIEAARRIIAISEATADDLRIVYPHLAEKVRVVHPGADHLEREDQDRPADDSAHPPCPRYVLFVGDRGTYKNFQTVLRAMTCAEWPVELPLVVVGAPFSDDEAATVSKWSLQHRILHLGRLSDVQLGKTYRKAVAFLFPSRCEGFGFPLLEAQSLKCPVICSDIPCFRETARNSAVFFDPEDAAHLAQEVRKISENEAIGEHLRRQGSENVIRFRWDRCADLTRSVYREALA
jgi:glycosyltransferase involved in cell wall biosynthesis